MTSLSCLLTSDRQAAATECEKGTYFEELIFCYLRNEATYRDLYGDVWTYSDWAVEIMGPPRYPLELFMGVVIVSLETMKIVRTLPNTTTM